MEQKLKILEKSIQYSFKDKGLLENALIHPSYTNENPKINYNNQRMEFLGDAVLKLIISDYIFKKNNDLAEGKLSILQNNLISNETLAKIAKKYKISLTQLSQAFVNSRDFVTSNIIGATTMEQLKENIDSINISLDEHILNEINSVHESIPNPAP